MNGAVEACVVTGANLGQPLGIVMLNADAARALDGARRPGGARGLAGRAPDDGSTTGSIRTSSSNAWWWSTEPWSVENGFITPTFKVKRNRIEEVYAPLFERWTASRRPVVWHTA